ncbi:hypothetical protein BU16DRAFT_565687 [Lophium mytilinum]|uniref:Nucleotidyl transferase AbiEii/AbiGii toxin family protein n=1 Tax=Lophium mytilinum TaxID=390894 RepID=A0A6A6QGZ9_9PEZI|nr:hypothetical protein BU16DRAFT_565687 [Lophium mytilinum]
MAQPNLQPGTYTYEHMPALQTMTRVFQANNIAFAIMGGFALKLRGSTRDTRDVDIALGCTMQRLIEVLSAQPRIRRPAGPTSGVMRVFVKVGGQLTPGIPELWVMVDLILRGSLGAPDNPQTASETVSVTTSVGPKQYLVLDILNTMISKLGAFFARGAINDYNDLVFLILRYAEQIYAIRAQLNQAHRQHFVTTYARTNQENRVRRVKHTLGVA